jgi:L-histidine N-alpha-methyltransferase
MIDVLVRPKATDLARLVGDIRAGLTATPKRLEPFYLYDQLGSALFDAICELPWYRITRAERALIERYAAEIVRPLQDAMIIVELGPGNGAKVAQLIAAAGARVPALRVHLIDVSRAALTRARRAARRAGARRITTYRGTFHDGLRELPRSVEEGDGVLALFLGSNIGNFEPDQALALLRDIRASLPADGGWFLLGTDLVKPESDLLAAYDDPLGVTAAFNRNLLVRLNHELDAGFDLSHFVHRACWNAAESRVEMHLVATVAHEVPIPGARCLVSFAEGESIWTESSYKYEPAGVVAMGRNTGWAARQQWIDDEAAFALTLFQAD